MTQTPAADVVEAIDGDEFNRGYLIAVSTLISGWGRSTQSDHLLQQIDADAAMVERMRFGEYDRDTLLDALASIRGETEL